MPVVISACGMMCTCGGNRGIVVNMCTHTTRGRSSGCNSGYSSSIVSLRYTHVLTTASGRMHACGRRGINSIFIFEEGIKSFPEECTITTV